jgi:cytochrome P450
VAAAHHAMSEYFTRLVDAIWAGPGPGRCRDGLIAMLARPGPARRLSHDEAVVMAAGLLIAGFETTSNQLAICVYLLLNDRRRWEHLRLNPDAIPDAVEEMLRWTSFITTGGTAHMATEDVPLSAGVVRAGEVVIPLIDAANRDPDVFEEPDRLDLERPENPHIAFGHGRHRCLGAELARTELQIAIGALLDQAPDLALAVADDELPWRRGMFISGIWHLPVRLNGVEVAR